MARLAIELPNLPAPIWEGGRDLTVGLTPGLAAGAMAVWRPHLSSALARNNRPLGPFDCGRTKESGPGPAAKIEARRPPVWLNQS